MKKKFNITKKTKIMDILEKKPKCIEILFNEGLHCIGCAFAKSETIEQGFLAHDFSRKKIEEVVKKLRKC